MNQKFWMLHFALGFLWQVLGENLMMRQISVRNGIPFGAMVMTKTMVALGFASQALW